MMLPVLAKPLCMQAGAKEVLQAIMDTGVENVTTDRAKFALTWLTVGADQDDFKAPKGEKTFEGKLPQSHAPCLHTQVCMTCMSATLTQVYSNGCADQHYQIMKPKKRMAAYMSDAECSQLNGLMQSCCGTVISQSRLQSLPWLWLQQSRL